MQPATLALRSDPCRCGSGREFEHCCGRPPERPAAPPPPPTRISERLLELAQPLLARPDLDDNELLHCLQLAMLAWNLAVLDATAADTTDIRAHLRQLGLRREVERLAARKARLFPDDCRQLVDVRLTRRSTGACFMRLFSIGGS